MNITEPKFTIKIGDKYAEYRRIIYKICHKAIPSLKVSLKTSYVLSIFLYRFRNLLFRHIETKNGWIDDTSIEIAVENTIPGLLGQKAILRAQRAYQGCFKITAENCYQTKYKTGLTLATKKFKYWLGEIQSRYILNGKPVPKIKKKVPVYLTGIIEYICTELIIAMGNRGLSLCTYGKGSNKIITMKHLILSIFDNQDYAKLFERLNIFLSEADIPGLSEELSH